MRSALGWLSLRRLGRSFLTIDRFRVLFRVGHSITLNQSLRDAVVDVVDSTVGARGSPWAGRAARSPAHRVPVRRRRDSSFRCRSSSSRFATHLSTVHLRPNARIPDLGGWPCAPAPFGGRPGLHEQGRSGAPAGVVGRIRGRGGNVEQFRGLGDRGVFPEHGTDQTGQAVAELPVVVLVSERVSF